MKKNTLLSLKCLLLLTCLQTSHAQLYSNGGFSTGLIAANGTIAPSSYSWSEAAANAGNATEANGTIGFSGFFHTETTTTNFSLADDFVVPANVVWNITDFSFYCYQTGYTGTVPPIDQLRIQLYNGDPSAGGTLIAGDMTTNVYDAANSSEALVYRTTNTFVPTPATAGTTRKIWKVRGNLTTSIPSGTYWVVYQAHGTNNNSVFFPPVTVAGSRGIATANAKQLTVTTSIWKSVLDSGNPDTAPDVIQEMPFLINENTLSIDNSLVSSIAVYPNPVQNFITISNVSDALINRIEITDLNGRLVKSEFSPSDSKINVTDLQTGMYLMKIISDKGFVVKKIIKK